MNKLTFDINLTVTISADEVEMWNVETGETKMHNEIPHGDLDKFVVKSYAQLIRDGDVEYSDVEYSEHSKDD